MRSLKKIVCVLFTLIFTMSPLNAFALKESVWDKFDLNNIFYYDMDGEVCIPSSSNVSGSDIFMIGDSITVASESELKSKISGIEINAQVSKQFGGTNNNNKSGLQILEENKDSLRKVIVMALGTNGSVSESDIITALSIIGSSRTLILTTNYKLGDENAYNSNNSIIKTAAEKNSNVKVADWAAAVKNSPEKYIVNSDQYVHPTNEGKTLFAETIASTTNGSGNGATGSGNTLYNGNKILSDESLQLISKNQSVYEKSANKYNIPWQILAVLHYRETGLKVYNPSNGQGVYQLYSYTAGGTNSNAFKPAGDISTEEFQRQTDIVAKLIRDRYASGLNLNTDDGVKTFFFRYNGTAEAYIAQARSLGFTEAEAKRGEGSPYVMNLADEKRDSSKNPNWKQIRTDSGPMVSANQQPGAFLLYAAIGGSSGYSSCSTGNSGNGDLNATAIALAWPEHGHGLTARDSYKTALADVGLSNYGDYYARIGASCDAFVATVFRYSGVDPGFICCGISGHGATWNYVTNSGKFEEVPNNASSLKPGDIRLSEGHIEMYIEVDGVGKIASASYGERTGEIGNFYDNSATFKAYRWKGN